MRQLRSNRFARMARRSSRSTNALQRLRSKMGQSERQRKELAKHSISLVAFISHVALILLYFSSIIRFSNRLDRIFLSCIFFCPVLHIST